MNFDSNYYKHLRSNKWHSLREKIIAEKKCRCSHCHKTFNKSELHLHHKSYQNFGNEKKKDVMLLCSKCHEKLHKGIRNGTLNYSYKKKPSKKYKSKHFLDKEEMMSLKKMLKERQYVNDRAIKSI